MPPARAVVRLRYAIETLWLVTVFLVPLTVASPDWMLTFVELPKLVVFRTLTGLLAILWAVEWAISDSPFNLSLKRPDARQLSAWLASDPPHWLIVAVIALAAANVLSTILSTSFSVSLWGRNPIEDGYGLYNMLSYLVLFAAVATRLRTKAQLWRLLSAIVAASFLTSVIGVLERYDIVQLGGAPSESVAGRMDSTFGNPIFFGAFLVMAIPVSIASCLTIGGRYPRRGSFAIWTAIVSVQLLALLFTLSRGPWIGLAAGLACFFALGLLAIERRHLARAAALLGIALAVSLLALRFGAPGGATSSDVTGDSTGETSASGVEAVEERLTSVYSDVASGSFTDRMEIWRASAKLLAERPRIPIEDDPLYFSRHLVGYGPDLYGFVYPLTAPTKWLALKRLAYSAHNHLIHAAVELGALGLLSQLALFGALFASAVMLLLKNRCAYSNEHRVALLAILAAISGRFVEQLVGIAHVSDLTLFWALLAVFVALPRAMLTSALPKATIPKRWVQPRATSPAWRYAAAVMVIAVFALLIWTRNANYLRADVAAASGVEISTSNPADALSLIDEAISLAPDVALYHDSRMEVLQELRSRSLDTEEQLALTEQIYVSRLLALDTRPFALDARLRAANAAMRLAMLRYQGMLDEAIRRYEELVNLSPNATETRTLLAIAYIEDGRFEDGLDVLEHLLTMNMLRTDQPEVYYLRGVVYDELGMKPEAVESLEQAFFVHEGNRAVRDAALERLTSIQVELGDYERANFYANYFR